MTTFSARAIWLWFAQGWKINQFVVFKSILLENDVLWWIHWCWGHWKTFWQIDKRDQHRSKMTHFQPSNDVYLIDQQITPIFSQNNIFIKFAYWPKCSHQLYSATPLRLQLVSILTIRIGNNYCPPKVGEVMKTPRISTRTKWVRDVILG